MYPPFFIMSYHYPDVESGHPNQVGSFDLIENRFLREETRQLCNIQCHLLMASTKTFILSTIRLSFFFSWLWHKLHFFLPSPYPMHSCYAWPECDPWQITHMPAKDQIFPWVSLKYLPGNILSLAKGLPCWFLCSSPYLPRRPAKLLWPWPGWVLLELGEYHCFYWVPKIICLTRDTILLQLTMRSGPRGSRN